MFELRDGTGVLGSFDSDGIRRLAAERRLHAAIEIRQLPNGDWHPIHKVKNLPAIKFSAVPPLSASRPCESGVDLSMVRVSAPTGQSICSDQRQSTVNDVREPLSDWSGNSPKPELTSASSIVASVPVLQRSRPLAATAQSRSFPLQLIAIASLAGLLGLLLGAAIGFTGARRGQLSPDAYQLQVQRAERAEREAMALRGDLEAANAPRVKTATHAAPPQIERPTVPSPEVPPYLGRTSTESTASWLARNEIAELKKEIYKHNQMFKWAFDHDDSDLMVEAMSLIQKAEAAIEKLKANIEGEGPVIKSP